MLTDGVVMEASLARLVFGLTPINSREMIYFGDKDFNKILTVWDRDTRLAKENKEDVILKVDIEYQFVGIDTRPAGGFVAVFQPRFLVNRSDMKWESIIFEKGRDEFYDELVKIIRRDVVELDIPDIVEIKTAWISMIPRKLVDGNPVWMIRT